MELIVEYDATSVGARITGSLDLPATVWGRAVQACSQADPGSRVLGRTIYLAWGAALPVILELGALRREFGFTMRAIGEAEARLRVFMAERHAVRAAREGHLDRPAVLDGDIRQALVARGFTRRALRDFQERDVRHLVMLRQGANFSVPGAGKTTVTFATHLLLRGPDTHFLVVAPKNAFGAWDEVVTDCMAPDAPDGGAERFIRLDGDDASVERLLFSGARRFIISYDKLIRVPQLVGRYLARHQVHVVLDESHRIKAGDDSARGRTVLALAALPVRRDILSGTPVPNALDDLVPQLDFLWPGVGLGQQVATAARPRDILERLYVRTTKHELGLESPNRHFVHVEMSPAQLAFYGVMKNEAIRQLTDIRQSRAVDFVAARRSVLRLLQAATNPVAAVIGMAGATTARGDMGAELLAAVIAEGDSAKMREAVRLARDLAAQTPPRKTVIWTIFRHTLERLEAMAADLNPVVLHGGVPAGSPDDPETREGRIRRFHDDQRCMVMIANPAACSEGISLHTVCHDAIYLDRSYNAAHYLQSVDRIHRLGLAPGVVTNITILQSVAPERVGSIDHSVSRRLAAKMRQMEDILEDADIRQMRLDEEEAEPPVDRDMTLEDFADLLQQLLTGTIPAEEDAA